MGKRLAASAEAVATDLFRRPPAALRRAVEAAAERVAAAQSAVATIEYGPVFAAPPTEAND